MSTIKTRFAPSPTGSLHIGGLRTALYAYALAKHNDGKFLLRIEDTDKKREVKGATEEIQTLLKTFNLPWDEFFVQSKRLNKYKEAADTLVKEGKAFYCDCPARNAKEEGFSKVLRDPCREKNLKEGAIKLKVPDGEKISFTDFVLEKEISWETTEVADTILLKSDGYPTYHLAVVVDDNDMDITHVLRGHDWLPSTPIHLLVYKYLGFKLPQIGHLTDILDPSGGKLSKRKGSTSCKGFLEEGYLPEAILNFIMLLGWAPKDNREIYSLDEFVKAFDEKGFQKSNPIFNREKLDWFNGEYIRKMDDTKLTELIFELNKKKLAKNLITKTMPLVKDRIAKLTDYSDFAGFFFTEKKADESLFGKKMKNHLSAAYETLEKIDGWKKESLDEELMKMIKVKDFKVGDFFMDLRIAIAGSKFTPPINESMIILGKETALKRIKSYL
jgi:glutamyl-tRNA synthetase